jgi:zinc and cadmium transporter
MIIYALGSVILISLISILTIIPFLIKKKISKSTLLFLLSISVGVLLSTVFLNFLPEIIEHEYTIYTALYILLGFMIMFIVEKFIHWKHTKKCSETHGHAHAYSLAPINVIGDAIHNLIDGLVIAGAYTANISLGIATTISIIFHEIPQEIADFGVLLYSGWSKKKAIIFNFLSAITAIAGTILGLFLATKTHHFTVFMLPFAAGNFLYIAATNLLPQLHRHCKSKDTFYHLLAIAIGITIIVLVTLYAPHVH